MSKPVSAPVHLLSGDRLLKRLSDPQVWVCAIAAFTLIGLSSGLLGGAENPRQELLLASATQITK
jgi:hypothetical protein